MAKQVAVPEAADASIVTVGTTSLTDDDLRGVTSFEDAMALASQLHGTVADFAAEYGTGFTLLTDKSQLEGTHLVLLQWRINDGDFGGFVSVVGVTAGGLKFIINDGSTGIYKQLYEISVTTQRSGGLEVRKGLRRSEYPTCGQCDRPRPAMEAECAACGDASELRHRGSTFYLDQSPD